MTEQNDQKHPESTRTRTSHTPGPWWVQHSTNVMANRESGFGKSKAVVANCGGYDSNGRDDVGDENSANARLIAAAPDLLEALTALGGMPDGFCVCFGHKRDPQKPEREHTGECLQARAALAKAQPTTDTERSE